MVKKSFLTGRNYMGHDDWVQHWQRALMADYVPQVDVQVLPKGRLKEDVWRAFSYAVKPAEMIADPEWMLMVSDQLCRARLVESYGALREVIPGRSPKAATAQQRHVSATANSSSAAPIRAYWSASEMRYKPL